MSLIEREAALEICEKEYQERLRMLDYCGDTVAWNIGGAIKGLPTIDPIRAAGGCRCGECKYRNDHGHCAHPRHEVLPTTYPNDFCSYGEKKEVQDDE